MAWLAGAFAFGWPWPWVLVVVQFHENAAFVMGELIYNYDPTTGRFTGAEPMEYSAEDGAPLIPAHSTTVQPLPRPAHLFNYWTGSSWELKPDLEKARIMLARRNAALAASDWTMLYDAPLWFWQRWQWMIYRNRLRNLTLNPQWPDVDLPKSPK